MNDLYPVENGHIRLASAQKGLPAVKEPPALTVTYAQHAEDVIANGILRALLPKKYPSGYSYLDIGANHPIANSNTYAFYERGCRGVLVEPNGELVKLIRFTRPEDMCLQAGVGIGKSGKRAYYYTTNNELNSFDRSFIENWNLRLPQQAVKITGRKQIQFIDINELIAESFAAQGKELDLLSIDVEGLDLEIAEGLAVHDIRPALVIIEISPAYHKDGRQRILREFLEKGYTPIHAGPVNTMFVDRVLLAKNSSAGNLL